MFCCSCFCCLTEICCLILFHVYIANFFHCQLTIKLSKNIKPVTTKNQAKIPAKNKSSKVRGEPLDLVGGGVVTSTKHVFFFGLICCAWFFFLIYGACRIFFFFYITLELFYVFRNTEYNGSKCAHNCFKIVFKPFIFIICVTSQLHFKTPLVP